MIIADKRTIRMGNYFVTTLFERVNDRGTERLQPKVWQVRPFFKPQGEAKIFFNQSRMLDYVKN
jgi:hypothetical protein